MQHMCAYVYDQAGKATERPAFFTVGILKAEKLRTSSSHIVCPFPTIYKGVRTNIQTDMSNDFIPLLQC